MSDEGNAANTDGIEPPDEDGEPLPDADEDGEPFPDPDEDGRYPADLVRSLRDEAARRRNEAKQEHAERLKEKGHNDALRAALLDAMVREHARSILADPTDLVVYVGSDTLVDDDDMPDTAKITEAANALVKQKPHLAARAATADVGQGPRGTAVAPFDFADILRKHAR